MNKKQAVSYIIFFVIALCCSNANADKWTSRDTAYQGTAITLLAVDWLQTKEIARNPEYHETNPILGRNPKQSEVDLYFAGCAIGHTLVAYYLPQKYRRWWQYVWIGVQSGYVCQNIIMGVRIAF